MDKEVYFDIVREYTKEPPPEKTKWAKKSKLCMHFIEFRNIDTIKQNLWNIANVYGGGDTALVIMHSGDNKDIIYETTKGWENVRYIQLYEHNVTKETIDHVGIDYKFWEPFLDYEYVLTNTWDSYIFKRIPEKYFNYDIAGGLVGHYYVQLNGQTVNICADVCKCQRCLVGDHFLKDKNFKDVPNKGYVYCGGFFLRNVRATMDLCKRKPWGGEPEDVYCSLSDLKKPTYEDAREFAVNHLKHPDPIGCHAPWVHDEEFVRSLFK